MTCNLTVTREPYQAFKVISTQKKYGEIFWKQELLLDSLHKVSIIPKPKQGQDNMEKKTTSKYMSSNTNIMLINWIQQYTKRIMHHLSLAVGKKKLIKSSFRGLLFDLHFTIRLQGSQERNSNREPGGTLFSGSLTDPGSANCLVQSQCTCLEMLPHTVGWATSCQSSIQRVYHIYCHIPI